MTRAHLTNGYDVVVPAFSVRDSFFLRVDQTVRETGAELHEIVLVADASLVVGRLRTRRAERIATGVPDVAADIPTDGETEVVTWALAALAEVTAARPGARVVSAEGDVDSTYELIIEVVAHGRSGAA
jgi:hypothetical protein